MEKQEFEKWIMDSVTDDEYRIIETVYQWHPSIDEKGNGEQMAELYKDFGMAVIKDMLPRAEKVRGVEVRLKSAQREVERIQDELAGLSY